MASDWMKTRQTKYAAYASVYVVVIIAVLAAVNFLANRYDKSYDTTANKQYSLSDQTLKVVKGLPRDVHVTYFGPTNDFGSAKDLLERYSSLSPKLKVDYIDPERKPQIAKAAGFRSDSPVVVDSGVRKEGAKSLTEEEITGALIRSLKSGERNVCFLSAGGEHSVDESGSQGYSYLKQLLERDNYKVRTTDLKPKSSGEAPKSLAVGQAPAAAGSVEVPKDCTVLVIGGPQTDYPAPVVNAIKSYVETGGRALIMLDDPLKIGRGEPPAENSELVKVLSDWGATPNKDLVLDISGLGQIFSLGPEVPLIASYESSPITQPLTRIPTAFPLSRSITTNSSGKATVAKLLGTSEDSLAVDSIGAGGAIDPKKGKKGPHTLAVTGTLSGSPQGRFILVGTSLWAQNSLIASRQLGNRDLFGNMINWLSSDEDLISIRPKEREDRPLNITASKINMLFWLSLVIFPLGVVGFGLATWWKRR